MNSAVKEETDDVNSGAMRLVQERHRRMRGVSHQRPRKNKQSRFPGTRKQMQRLQAEEGTFLMSGGSSRPFTLDLVEGSHHV